jgi:hypothetical protein
VGVLFDANNIIPLNLLEHRHLEMSIMWFYGRMKMGIESSTNTLAPELWLLTWLLIA